MKKLSKVALWKQILVAVILGLIVGFAWPAAADKFAVLGNIFIALMKMLLVPVVFFSLVHGVCSLGDVKLIRTIGVRYVGWIVGTTLLAAAVSVTLSLVLNPGAGVTLGDAAGTGSEVMNTYSFADTLVSWIPSSVVGSMANNQLLPTILFALLLGACILVVGDKASTVMKFNEECMNVFLQMTNWIVALAPIGIFGLVAPLVPRLTGALLTNIGKFLVIDFVGVALMFFVVYPLLLLLLGKTNPIKFYGHIINIILMAAASGSSAACLPLEMETARDKMGIDERLYSFTLPLGNTCNMNAAAIAQACVAVFALNVYGYEVTPMLVFEIVTMACLMAVGTVGIKGAQIVISTVMLSTLGLPLDLVAVFSPLWAIVDPVNTATNVTGDVVGTVIVAKQLNMIDESVYNG